MSMPLISREREFCFPPGFKFGVADADLQVIGEDYTVAEEGSEPTMWLHFTQQRGMETPGKGIDRFHRWQEDIEHLKRLGIRHYRTSISISRTLLAAGGVNERGINWYRQYFTALKAAGIKVYVTLYHWELPQYLHEQGGWTNRQTALAFQKHVAAVVKHMDEFIEEYFILNEPWCSSLLSYYEGKLAPGRQYEDDRANLRAGLSAAHHLLLAQGLAVRGIKQANPQAKVGTVLNFEPAYAASSAPEDVLAASYRDGYYNRWFLEPTFTGRYPENMLELYGEDALPSGYESDMDTIKVGNQFHALGVNYYRGSTYRAAGGDLRSEQVLVEGAPTNSLDWPIYEPPYYPEGLYDILQQIYFGCRPFGLKKMYVSENGMALRSTRDGKDGAIDDAPRIDYYREHMRQLGKAIERGIPVDGFFAWTLMDNFEWSEGYRPDSAFGMIYVDRETMERVPKKSATWYSQLLKTRSIPGADAALNSTK